MVRTSTIIAVVVTLLVSLVLPVIVYIVYGVKNKGKGVWTAWLLGAAGFIVFQMVIRIPALNVLALHPGFVAFSQKHYILYCFILALTAALFEVAGRYIVAKILSKKPTFERGMAAGLGHGGIEAMMLIGMTYINNLVYILMINTGSFDAVVEQTAALGVDTSALVTIKETLINSGSFVFYLAGFERILTMIGHTALSLVVCYFVWKKKDLLGIGICVVCHFLIDFVSPVVNGLATVHLGNVLSVSAAYVIIYVFLTIVAIISILAIKKLKGKWESAV
ncbi:MAG: YhfC family intramembrane metalloprotease [Lachnospiraceae bacterium]|nr:YhfC family intramembrane metalloprotease [Lachnospiraceae bacterium]